MGIEPTSMVLETIVLPLNYGPILLSRTARTCRLQSVHRLRGVSRGSEIRTRGLFVPNEARYQAALCPGAGHWARTSDLLITSELLYQLS